MNFGRDRPPLNGNLCGAPQAGGYGRKMLVATVTPTGTPSPLREIPFS
jgi:hypothetical protein